jgi:hypothetical protein
MDHSLAAGGCLNRVDNEFQKILSPENAGYRTENGNGDKNNNLPTGILTHLMDARK